MITLLIGILLGWLIHDVLHALCGIGKLKLAERVIGMRTILAYKQKTGADEFNVKTLVDWLENELEVEPINKVNQK